MTVTGPDGSKVGKVGQVFLDDETGLPEFVTVQTGMFGRQESFVPLAEASLASDTLRVPYDKARVTGAPRVQPDSDLSQQEEGALYSYYGLGYSEQGSDSGLPTQPAAPHQVQQHGRGDVPLEVSRAEERLQVGTQRVESGRVRLRKHIVTETVSTAVPVTTEQVRVSREPITDPSAVPAARIEEAEREVVLSAERPVVEKEVVPVERVRLDKQQVSEQVTVSDQVRSEQVEMLEQRGDGTVTRTDVDSDPRH